MCALRAARCLSGGLCPGSSYPQGPGQSYGRQDHRWQGRGQRSRDKSLYRGFGVRKHLADGQAVTRRKEDQEATGDPKPFTPAANEHLPKEPPAPKIGPQIHLVVTLKSQIGIDVMKKLKIRAEALSKVLWELYEAACHEQITANGKDCAICGKAGHHAFDCRFNAFVRFDMLRRTAKDSPQGRNSKRGTPKQPQD